MHKYTKRTDRRIHCSAEDFNTSWDVLLHDYQGIWGDYRYFDTLSKYSSIAKAEAVFLGPAPDYDHFIVELQIGEDGIMTDSPFSMEPYPLDKERYSIKIAGLETLILIDKKVNEKHLYKKIPYNEILDEHLTFPYFYRFAIEKMHFSWFNGSYQMLDSDGGFVSNLNFDSHRRLSGYKKHTQYTLGTDIDNQNYLMFSIDGDWRSREYFLFEHKNNSYTLYKAEEPDDYDLPLIKKDIKFVLKKN